MKDEVEGLDIAETEEEVASVDGEETEEEGGLPLLQPLNHPRIPFQLPQPWHLQHLTLRP
jgi:hypothetical protein